MNRAIISSLVWLALAGGAFAQTAGGTSIYAPTGTRAFINNFGTIEANTPVPTGSPPYISIQNVGPNAAAFVQASSDPSLTMTTGDRLLPGQTIIEPVTGTTIYAITASGTTALQIDGVALVTQPILGASGALASGSIASGAFASGSVASGAFASGSIASGAIVDGADVGEGATTAAAATVGSTGAVNAKLRLMTSQLDSINTNLNTINTSTSAISTNTLDLNSHAHSSSLGTSLIAKASAGTLSGFYCNAITGGAVGYCIAYNSTTVPGTGALTGANVLDTCYLDGTPGGCSLSRIPTYISASTGIVILLSSAATPLTYTTGTDTGFLAADYQ